MNKCASRMRSLITRPPKTVAASLTALLVLGGSSLGAAELEALRKGRLPSGADGVMSPQGLVPGLERRGPGIRRVCDERVPADSGFGVDRPRGRPVPLSSYEDDPFVGDSIVECLRSSQFGRVEEHRLSLSNDRVAIVDEPVVYRQDPATGVFLPFANNPWPLPISNADGNFLFPDEPRFPRHEIERDANGTAVLRDGLQIWKPREIYRGMNATFEAANAARDAAEHWSGRELRWGVDNLLFINSHTFVGFNALFSPSAMGLFFGVVPYRLPGETGIENIKMFETATSWEFAAHESGHALLAVLKPNRDFADQGYRTWTESFADQIAMWTALRDPSRVESLLAETNDLSRSNPLSAFGEAFAALVGEGTGLRDAVHDKKVSDTSPEVHDRSEVFTGASYKFFLSVLGGIEGGNGAQRALMKAGEIMGTFLTRAADYTPENTMTLEDVAKAYLKVDKEFYDGEYHSVLVDEFTRREIFHLQSVAEWLAHEAAVPALRLRGRAAERKINALIQANLEILGIAPEFGLELQGVTRDQRLRQTIVRVQLMLGRGETAVLLDNHGILTFRANGRLADYHGPLPSAVAQVQGQARVQDEARVQARALTLIERAKQLGLDRHGVPLSIVRKPDGELTVEAQVIRGSGMNAYAEVFTLENPQGERREIITPLVPRGKAPTTPDPSEE